MGAGKTKQVIDAAQVLFEQGEIDSVIVVSPASVRSVWFDPEFGELVKHLWIDTPPSVITQYHATLQRWAWGSLSQKPLQWTITNYDFIRNYRLNRLLDQAGPRTLLVLDESSAVKNHRAQQTKSCLTLRQKCGRVVLLNGTPISNSPGDLYAQGFIMNPLILGCKNYYHFRARYAQMGGWQQKQIVAWHDLDDIQKRFAPHVLRRLKIDCLDLPLKLDPVTLSVPLSCSSWDVYREMKEEMIAWLSQQAVAVAPQAGVKALRLSQITSGFLGGIQDPDGMSLAPRELGSEKLDAIVSWLVELLQEDAKAKVVIWCRFRYEVNRIVTNILTLLASHVGYIGRIWGGQPEEERQNAVRLLDPRTTPDSPVVVVGTPASGALGINLTAAHTVLYASNDHSLKTRLQSEDRVHRPGQTSPVSYFDLIATGPEGQRTIDAVILKALRSKEDVATWTCSAWVQALREL